MQPDVHTGKDQESKLHFLDYWRIIRIRKAVIFLVFLLVVLTTSVVSFLLPEKYSSTARINVKKDATDIDPLMGGFSAADSQFDPYWIQTQFQIIQSQEVLDPVITNKLDLMTKWSERYKIQPRLTLSDTRRILKNSIEISQYQNTSFIEITAIDREQQVAADIANAIADSYAFDRTNRYSGLSEKGLDELEDQLDIQVNSISNLQERLDDIRTTNDIKDIGLQEGSVVVATPGPQKLSKLEGSRTDVRITLARYESLHETLYNMTFEEFLKEALTLVPNDQRIARLISQLDTAEQYLEDNPEDLGPEHPGMKSKLDLRDKVLEQLRDAFEGTVSGLQKNIDAQRLQELKLVEEINTVNTNEHELARKYRLYNRTKYELETKKSLVSFLRKRIFEEEVNMKLPTASMVTVYDKAEPSGRPVSPNLTLNIVLGVIVGLVAGVGLAFFIEYLDTSVKTIDDVEKVMESPVLGVIPQNVGSLLDEGPESPHAEAYRILRTNILFSRTGDKGGEGEGEVRFRRGEDRTTMTVVSGGAGEGKSTTIFNLATIFAQNHNRVLLVDSDLRRPSLHRILGVSNARGLTDYLMEDVTVEEVIQTTRQEGMDFLPSGKLLSSSMGVLNSERMRSFIKEMKSRYDFVFFDSPPIMGVSDASVLTREVDMALLVIQYRKYPQAMTIRAKQMVEKVGNNLLGVVLNNINISQDSYYYYYSGYYYDYYSRSGDSSGEEEREPERKY